jgi:outer membrane protein assembly factor BamA
MYSASPKKPKPAKIKISGYNLIGDYELKRILRTLELGRTKPEFFGESFIEDAALILTTRIQRDGYLHPQISIRLTLVDGKTMQVEADSLIDNPLPDGLKVREARFDIHKGVLFYFQNLSFEGLEPLTEKEARSYFVETGSLLPLKARRIYTPNKLKSSLSSLKEVLARKGYEQANAEATGVSVDNKTGAATVHVKVNAGIQTVVRSVREEFVYEGIVNSNDQRTVFPNQPYSRVWEQDFAQSLKTNQYHRGYPDTSVDIQTLKREEGRAPVLPEKNTGATAGSVLHLFGSGRKKAGTALVPTNRIELDLLTKVDSGAKIHIGNVEFEGQSRTKHSLLARRVRVKRGELLDRIYVEEGRYRLAQLGAFESVDLNYLPVDEHTRDVTYRVKEGKKLDFSLLAGWGSYELLRGGFEAEAHNVWGEGHEVRLKGVQSFKATSGDFTYTIPEFVGRDVDLFFNGSGLRREEVSFTREEYGGGFGGHKFFKPAATDLRIRYNYEIVDAADAFGFVATEGRTNANVSSIITDFKLDRRDNPLYPAKGFKVFATLELATEYLGGDVNYERMETWTSWHYPLGGGRTLSLGLSHGLVVANGSNNENLPFNRRFFPGGENSIRGYTEGRASPRNDLGEIVGAETYTLGTVEFEQALTPKWGLVLFSDSLGMAKRINHYPFDTGLFSVGVGLRWKTVVGPVRLEYGYNLNPRPQDSSGAVQFSLGFPF